MKRDPSLRSLDVAALRARVGVCQDRITHRLPGQDVRPIRAWLTRYSAALALRGAG